MVHIPGTTATDQGYYSDIPKGSRSGDHVDRVSSVNWIDLRIYQTNTRQGFLDNFSRCVSLSSAATNLPIGYLLFPVLTSVKSLGHVK